MDQQVFNFLVGTIVTLTTVIGSCVAWWVNNIWSMVKNLQAQITDLNVELARNYVPRQELKETFGRIFDKLDEIQRDVRDKK